MLRNCNLKFKSRFYFFSFFSFQVLLNLHGFFRTVFGNAEFLNLIYYFSISFYNVSFTNRSCTYVQYRDC